MPTGLHFASKNPPKSYLGGVLGHLGGVLGALGGLLSLRGLLGHLNPSWRRLSEVLRRFEASSRPPGVGPNRVPIESSQRHPSSDPRPLKGVQLRGKASKRQVG